MKDRWIARGGWICGLALLAMLAGSGCEIRSSSTVSRYVLYMAGLYRHPEGERIVDRNSGAAVKSLFVRQQGDRIEALDNNGRLFRGTIVGESDSRGTFELRGDTTSGVPVTLSGTLSLSGSKAYMTATWIEPALFGTLIAEADVVAPAAPTPTPTNDVRVAVSN